MREAKASLFFLSKKVFIYQEKSVMMTKKMCGRGRLWMRKHGYGSTWIEEYRSM